MAPFSNDNNSYASCIEDISKEQDGNNSIRTTVDASSTGDDGPSTASTTTALQPSGPPTSLHSQLKQSPQDLENEVHPQVQHALEALFCAASSRNENSSNTEPLRLTIGGNCPKTKRRLAVLDQSTALHLASALRDFEMPLSLRFHCSICPNDVDTPQIMGVMLQQLSLLQAVEIYSSAFLERRYDAVRRRNDNHGQEEVDIEGCELGDCALLRCLANTIRGTFATNKSSFRLKLVGFDWNVSFPGSLRPSYVAATQVLRECASFGAVNALEFQECVFPMAGASRAMIQSLSCLTDLQEFSLQQCQLTDAVASKMMDALLHQTRLSKLCLSRCQGSLEAGFLKSLNHVICKLPLRELVLSEDPASAPGNSCRMFGRPALKQEFLHTLQYGNDSLIQLNLITSCSGAFMFHRKLQACVKRNRLHQSVRMSLQATGSLSSLKNDGSTTLGDDGKHAIWSHGLARLANQRQPGISAMYLALTGLAPQLPGNIALPS